MFGAEILSETYPLYTQQWYMQYWNFSVTNTIAVCTVKNSWWWTEELFETCRVLFQNKFEKLVHLVGFIIGIYRDGRSYKCQVYIYLFIYIYKARNWLRWVKCKDFASCFRFQSAASLYGIFNLLCINTRAISRMDNTTMQEYRGLFDLDKHIVTLRNLAIMQESFRLYDVSNAPCREIPHFYMYCDNAKKKFKHIFSLSRFYSTTILLLLSSSSSSSSPLCRVFILIFLRQTMSLRNTVL